MPNYVQQNATQSTLLVSGWFFSQVYRLVNIGDTAAMKPESNALTAISADAPTVSEADVAAAVVEQFGLHGQYTSLVSERDQNFKLCTTDGAEFVVKVVGSSEDATSTDFRIGALQHLENDPGVRTPKVVRTSTGDSSGWIADGGMSYYLRVVTWVSGTQLERLGIDEQQAAEFGRALARLDRALDGYSHAGERPELLWDLQRAGEVRELLDYIDDIEIRSAVRKAVSDFEQNVLPVMPGLQSQVIHGDANLENVLVEDGEFGFIDFGDMIRAPRLFDVAIASAYLRNFGDNPTVLIESFVAGYHDEVPIDPQEVDLLFDLIRARLATTIALFYWRLDARDENDPYRQKALELESGASRFLDLLDKIGPAEFTEKLAYIQ